MNHLDEGTIHAWLDGGDAFDATQARDIEAHIAQCQTCSAAVAEARGLIAGASRILNALDDVPAGVVPKRASPPTRQWRAARWVTSIAAALMLAIGITTWNRGAIQKEMPLAQRTERVAAPALSPTTPAAPTESKSKTAAKPERDAARRKASGAAVNRADELERGAAAPSGPLANQALSDAAKQPAPAAPQPAMASPEPRRVRSFDPSTKLEQVVVTATGSGAVSEAAQAAGCYRMPAISDARRLARVVGEAAGAAGAVRTSSGSRAPTRTSAAPSAASADFAAMQPPAMVRLDTVRRPLGYIARSAASDTSVGWWSRWGSDSVRVDLLAAGIFTFATKDRATCPER